MKNLIVLQHFKAYTTLLHFKVPLFHHLNLLDLVDAVHPWNFRYNFVKLSRVVSLNNLLIQHSV